MALQALRARLRPRTRLKKLIIAAASHAEAYPRVRASVVFLLKAVPPIEARLRRMVTRNYPQPVVSLVEIPPSRAELTRATQLTYTRLRLARDQAREGGEHGAPTLHVDTPARPRLAFVSPFPPQQSGIADYSVELLDELSRHYDITLVNQPAETSDGWLASNFTMRDPTWLVRHGASFDRVLYHFGNSHYHAYMLDLLAKVPGVVVLHDFYLSGLRLWLYRTKTDPAGWIHALLRSHGYPALDFLVANGDDPTAYRYPANKEVLDTALGVIVHSNHALTMAEQHYGLAQADRFRQVPFLKKRAPVGDRVAARRRLDVAEDAWLVCSFGHLHAVKRNDALLEAWLASEQAKDPRAHLIFVGQNEGAEFGQALLARIEAAGLGERIRITGFNSAEDYAAWLSAADVAVQLRTESRGETSAAVFDCMAHGLPVIINAHGSAAELPEHVVIRLADRFAPADLQAALDRAWRDPAWTAQMAAAGLAHVHRYHLPTVSTPAYRDAIENLYATYGEPLRELRSYAAGAAQVGDDALELIARSLAQNADNFDRPSWFIDVSALLPPVPQVMPPPPPPEDPHAPPPPPLEPPPPIADLAAGAGANAQQSFGPVLDQILRIAPDVWRIQPVYFDGHVYRHAHRLMLRKLGISQEAMDDTRLDTYPGDRFLGLGLVSLQHEAARDELQALQRRQVRLHWLIAEVPAVGAVAEAPSPVMPVAALSSAATPAAAPTGETSVPTPPPAPVDPREMFFKLLRYVPLRADSVIAPDVVRTAALTAALVETGLTRPGVLRIRTSPIDLEKISAQLADPLGGEVWPAPIPQSIPSSEALAS